MPRVDIIKEQKVQDSENWRRRGVRDLPIERTPYAEDDDEYSCILAENSRHTYNQMHGYSPFVPSAM